MDDKQILILGGGITGLQIAKQLSPKKFPILILEKRKNIGGMCSSFVYKSYHFDLGPHKFFTQLDGIYDEFKEIVKQGNFYKVRKKNSIFFMGKSFEFPVKFAELLLGLKPSFSLKFGFSFGTNLLRNIISKKRPRNYEEYFIKGFGKVGYNLLFYSYAKKVWGDPKFLSIELARKRVPVSGAFDLLKKMIFARKSSEVSAEYFYYPKKGFGQICKSLANDIKKNKGIIITESKIVQINHKQHNGQKRVSSVVYKKDGKEKKVDVDKLVSTIRLLDLVQLIKPKVPKKVLEAAKNLKYGSLIILYLVIDKERVLEDNWIFFPEKEYIFNRISEQKSFSKDLFPKGKTGVMVEVTCDSKNAFFKAKERDVFKRIVLDLEKTGLIKEKEVIDYFTIRIPNIYPIYSLDYLTHLNTVLDYLNSFENIYTVGRMGLFNYNNSDHCLDMGLKTAQHIVENGTRHEWARLVRYFNSYKIVD